MGEDIPIQGAGRAKKSAEVRKRESVCVCFGKWRGEVSNPM